MRTEVIQADTIDTAVERILDELKGRSLSSRDNVIYFDGWDGLGASAVLRAVSQHLTDASEAPAGLLFDQIIHIDCSMWESRRALQRAIAKQLDLPAWVMDILDRQDEEDDYHGVAQGSRAELPQVVREMYQVIQKLNLRFLVIFHNGSSEEIDLSTFCGFPLSGYSTNKVLWTFQGRFRLKPRMKIDNAINSTRKTDVFLSASHYQQDPHELWSFLVCQEAAEVACDSGPSNAAEFFLYLWKLCGMIHNFRIIDYDLGTHCCNYWICDGIIQQLQQANMDDVERAWRTAEALQDGMQLSLDYYHSGQQYLPSHLLKCGDSMATMPYWTSPSCGVVLFPGGDVFQHFEKLCVLKLSRCTFNFSLPPFIFCHGLRFLWLDHCQDNKAIIGTDEEDEEHIRQCFQRLWVLDVRYTCSYRILSAPMMDLMTQLRELNVMGVIDWDVGQLKGRLPNIRKLRVMKSSIHCSSCSEHDLFSTRNKMELLNFSGNSTSSPMASLSVGPGIINSNSSNLETIIIDGCTGVKEIILRGCDKLKNLLLRGLFQHLYSLDVSGTALKTLDLSATTIVKLSQLYLLGCNKLCAILWPSKSNRKNYVDRLCIDTTQSASSSSSSSLSVLHGGKAPSKFDWCILVRDARFLMSVEPVKTYFCDHYYRAYVEISSPTHSAVDVGDNIREDEGIIESHISSEQQMPIKLQWQKEGNSMYEDVADSFKDHLLQAKEGGVDTPTIVQMVYCPQVPYIESSNCYLHIQDRTMTKLTLGGEETVIHITIPDFICDNSSILHVHDSLFITTIPGPTPSLGSTWLRLRWCRVERCPNLDCVFTAPGVQEGGYSCCVFYRLSTFWVTQLPRARFIWNWRKPSSVFQLQHGSFEDLKLLHVDLCPRLIHVLPLPLGMVYNSMRNLVTLEIIWCGDLREVFPLDTDDAESHQQQAEDPTTVEFQFLKYIHLHELPKLQGICGRWKMFAPMLETVKIRGCWSLTRLPAVRGRSSKDKVICDCEKEWWDRLQWDGVGTNHQPSLYNPTHSQYYKKTTLLRGSLLR
ncbi:hypothetical protein ACP4OV_011867 [Aristida adscensionis]